MKLALVFSALVLLSAAPHKVAAQAKSGGVLHGKSLPMAYPGIIVGVKDMTCGSCKAKVEAELEKLRMNPKYKDKILQIEVSLSQKNATIKLVPTVQMTESEQKVFFNDIAQAITKAGYQAEMQLKGS